MQSGKKNNTLNNSDLMSQLLMQKQRVKEYAIQYSACEKMNGKSLIYTYILKP